MATKTTETKRKNPPDATLRNTRASRKAERSLADQVRLLQNGLRQVRSRITALERYARPKG